MPQVLTFERLTSTFSWNYMVYRSIDLFAGCGGLTAGMQEAGFKTVLAIDNNPYAARTYRLNFPKTRFIEEDIRTVNISKVLDLLKGKPLHLLAGCPPCQGFSSLRRLNRKDSVRDHRNSLLLEFHKFVSELKPFVVMMENVPGLKNYYLFRKMLRELRKTSYNVMYRVVNVKDYGVPQRRERLVLMASRLGPISIADVINQKVTVRETIGDLETPENTDDLLHKIVAKHTIRIQNLISKIPKNGGSRNDLSDEFTLDCHKKKGVGFNDIYGRLKWDDYSSTITGGCLNPSKGRFLHPDQNRVITPREASMLQSFDKHFKFPLDIPKHELALMIGNALPPAFSYFQCVNVRNHLKAHLG